MGSGATVLSTNTKANADSKTTKYNVYYKNYWPSFLMDGKDYGLATNYLKSDKKTATYMKNALIWENHFKMAVYYYYYDSNYHYLSKESFYVKFHVPYYKLSKHKVVLASASSDSAKDVLIWYTDWVKGHGHMYRVNLKNVGGKNINLSRYYNLYSTSDSFDKATAGESN